jgi:hypothetical protein
VRPDLDIGCSPAPLEIFQHVATDPSAQFSVRQAGFEIIRITKTLKR